MCNNLKHEFENVQKPNNMGVMKWLKENLNDYCKAVKDERDMSAFFVQNCLYPRLMFSPSDALYSIKFIKILVDLRVPKINFLNIFG